MHHIFLSRAQYLRHGRKCVDMSYISVVVVATAISSSQLLPSGIAGFLLESLAASRTSLWGFWPTAVVTCLTVAASSGAMWQPEINHQHSPDATWKFSTLGPCCCIALTWNWDVTSW